MPAMSVIDNPIMAPFVQLAGARFDGNGNLMVAGATGGAASSFTPAATTVAQTATLSSSLVLKAAPGALSSCYATTGSTAGYLMIFDALTPPANGAVSPRDCVFCPANATTALEVSFFSQEAFATGIVAVFSSTGPFVLTASATAFLKGISL